MSSECMLNVSSIVRTNNFETFLNAFSELVFFWNFLFHHIYRRSYLPFQQVLLPISALLPLVERMFQSLLPEVNISTMERRSQIIDRYWLKRYHNQERCFLKYYTGTAADETYLG